MPVRNKSSTLRFPRLFTTGLLQLALLVLIWSAMTEAGTPEGCSSGSFADGGLFRCGTMYGGTLAHRRIEFNTDINDWLRAQQANDHFVILQLPAITGRQYPQLLYQWLQRTQLDLIDGLLIGDARHPVPARRLRTVHEMIREFSETPVYVWAGSLDESAETEVAVDGYWHHDYELGYSDFRNIIARHSAAGKKLVMCVEASLFSSLKAARERVMICSEFDIPVSYLAVNPTPGMRNCNAWLNADEASALLAPYRNFVFSALEFQRRSRPPWSLTAGDFMWGDLIELNGDLEGRVEYEWSGLNDSTVYGFKSLQIKDGKSIRNLDNREVSLDWQFWSILPVREVELRLETADPTALPRVEVSRHGRVDEWYELQPYGSPAHFNLGNAGTEFRIRLTFPDSSAVVKGAGISGYWEIPSDRAVQLYPEFFNGWRQRIKYQQNLRKGQWRSLGQINNPENLEPGPELSMRGRDGRSVSAEIIQKFSSEKPLRDIMIKLRGNRNRSLGGSIALGVSLDGNNILVEGEAEEDGNVYRIDLREIAAFRRVREFHVHMRQRNNSGRRTNISSRLHNLEIEAGLH